MVLLPWLKLLLLLLLPSIRSFPLPLQESKQRHTSSLHTTVIEEHSIADGYLHSISIKDNNSISDYKILPKSAGSTTIRQSLSSLKLYPAFALKLLKRVFLPVDYPKSVPPEYLRFQCWNLIQVQTGTTQTQTPSNTSTINQSINPPQDSCSYLRGIMSTQAILEGMGVGRSDITAMQATIQWVLRDGASLVGSLVFTTLSSYNFGQNVKLWRLFADSINNVGITLDMIAPLFRQHFLVIVCIASICKALCSVAAGATGAAIAEHWGEQNGNIGDVTTRNNAQHTMVSLAGLAVSVKFARYANSSPQTMWTIYLVLTVLHMFRCSGCQLYIVHST